MSDVLLGVDIGTGSSKGVLTRPDGHILAEAERLHHLSLPKPGWAEHDAEKIWWADFLHLCHELLTDQSHRVAAVCVSGIGPCVLPATETSEALRPAILYGIDTRAKREIEAQHDRYGQEQILKRCGSILTSQAVGPKLEWLRINEPEIWRQTRRFFMASSFIVQRLTGEYVLDHHSASQCDPLYDLQECDWITEWADDIAPDLTLPRLSWPSEIVGKTGRQVAQETGIPAGTPVAAGTIDAWAEAVSVGVSSPGDIMLMYGSTMFMIEVVTDPAPTPQLWTTNGTFAGTRTLAAGMATSGSLTSWFRSIAGGPTFEDLLSDASSAPPGSAGLVVLPYFAGERTPIFDPAARGTIIGLTLSHSRGHIYRALLEATAYGVRHNLETFDAAGAQPKRLVAVGGGTKGGLWVQIVSDVLGRSQELPSKTIGASFGDSFLAAIGAGLVDANASWSRTEMVVTPNEQVRGIYEKLYGIYRALYPSTKDLVHELASLQEAL